MNPKLNLTEADLAALLQLIQTHLPNVEIWAFGSRGVGTNRESSDLDLAAFASETETRAVSNLREALEESNLPMRVDLHIWQDLPEHFQSTIRETAIRLC